MSGSYFGWFQITFVALLHNLDAEILSLNSLQDVFITLFPGQFVLLLLLLLLNVPQFELLTKKRIDLITNSLIKSGGCVRMGIDLLRVCWSIAFVCGLWVSTFLDCCPTTSNEASPRCRLVHSRRCSLTQSALAQSLVSTRASRSCYVALCIKC